VASYDGVQSEWTEETIDLTPYVGTSAFKVRFTLDSDGWVQRDGWYVDDVHVFADQPTGVDDAAVSEVSLGNFPNPFRPTTSVKYSIPNTADVELSIYDVSGRLVRALVSNPSHAAGRYSVPWDGRDNAGRPVAAGVYFARLTVDNDSSASKMVKLK
jgi:hypothetical protein